MQASRWFSGAAMVAGTVLLIAPALAGSAAQTAPPVAAQAPTGPGHDAFLKVCSGCHLTTLATTQRKSADDWATIVIEMRNRGANATDPEMEQIVQYLADNFGPTAAPARVNINAAPSAEIAGALSISLGQGQAIVTYREQNGKFKDLGAVKQVPGLDVAKVEAAKDRIDF